MMSKEAYIHPDAKIGTNVVIKPFSFIDKGVVIGDNTEVGPNATIYEGSIIGKNCRIFPGAVIGAVPQDLKFNGEITTAEVGDNTTIREFVTINRGTAENKTTAIGKNCLIMAYCHVAHDCMLGDNVIMANCVNLAGHVTIEDFAILEGLVAVQQFVHIGAHTFITGGSLVRKNVPPYVKAGREPLSYVGINSVGLKRRGYSEEFIHSIEEIYRTLYVKGYNISNALKRIETEISDSNQKETIVEFIRGSEKGIMRGLASMNGSNS